MFLCVDYMNIHLLFGTVHKYGNALLFHYFCFWKKQTNIVCVICCIYIQLYKFFVEIPFY